MALDLVTFKQTLSDLVNIPSTSPIAVAVSGGPDSMVLCHLLAKIFPNTTALILDHGLRSESNTEALLTEKRLNILNIKTKILTWVGGKPTTRIQETARQVRHQLLQNWCYDHGILSLFMAHHFDDQWETLYMRHKQNSGSRGMIGITPLTFRRFGMIVRPLLTYSKQDILDYADHTKLEYVIDPSNLKPTYERGRIRLNRSNLEAEFPSSQIQTLINSAQTDYKETSVAVIIFMKAHLRVHPYGCLMINRTACKDLVKECQYALIQRITSSVTEYSYPMPKAKIDKLIGDLESGKRSTLGGWLYSPKQDLILISREHRTFGDLGFTQHTPIPIEVFPSYVTIPPASTWIKFENPLS